jgi:hypothetical protein
VWVGGLAALLIATALLIVVGRALDPGTRARFPSATSGKPEGLMGILRLLEAMEIPTEIVTSPWTGLAVGSPSPGVLVVALPLQRAVREVEADALDRWVRGGGAVLIVDDASSIERSGGLDAWLARIGVEQRSPAPEVDPITLKPARPALLAAAGTDAAPAGRDVRRVMLHRDGELLPTGDGVPLVLSDAGAVVAAEVGLERGRVLVVQGPLLANDKLLVGDTLRLALRFLEDLRGDGPVRFDEYHHGFGGALVAVGGLRRVALVAGTVQALVVLLLYAFARGIRFGGARPRRGRDRRSNLEFVHSMASLYRRAAARSHLLHGYVERLTREFRARWALQESLTPREMAAEVARRTGRDPESLEGPMAAARNAAARGARLDEETMLERARDLARLEREVFGGSGKGR